MSDVEPVEIRVAQPSEAAHLTEIARAAKRHWGYENELIDLWADELTVTPELVTANPVYCAASGSKILGFYALAADGEVYELEHMWVDPAHMGSGVGTLLFEHAAEAVAALGGSVLRIASDPNAEGFYRKMGAVPAGRVPSRPVGRTLPLLTFVIESSGVNNK